MITAFAAAWPGWRRCKLNYTRSSALPTEHFHSRRPAGSRTAPVRDLQIVIPVQVVLAQLPTTDDGGASIG